MAKVKKKRAKKYETKLAIAGTLDEVLKLTFAESPKKKKKSLNTKELDKHKKRLAKLKAMSKKDKENKQTLLNPLEENIKKNKK